MKEESDSIETARKVERSRAYPGISLEAAILFTQSIAKSFIPTQVINRDDIAAVIGKKSTSIEREVAAAVQFGLLTKEKSGYQIAAIVKSLTYPIDLEEKRKYKIECFKTPKLFKELIEKYDNAEVPELKPILIRFHGIAERAADDAEEIFRLSAEYCGVLDAKGFLNTNSTSKPPIVVHDAVVLDPPYKPSIKETQVLQLPVHEDNGEQVKIRLSNKKYAYLTYPDDLNSTDIEILKKEIEKLELMIK